MSAIVDFHIHLYRGYHLQDALFAARSHCKRQFPDCPESTPLVWCLTERAGQHWFRDLSRQSSEAYGGSLPAHWKPVLTDDGLALRIELDPSPLFLVAGRQIITEERLELLCLTADLDIADGIPMREGISAIQEAGGIPVIPWSPGKWMGKRGQVLASLLSEKRCVYLGDTAIRPGSSWGKSHFDAVAKEGLARLPGSDPLPARGETKHFCRLSALLDIATDNPASELRDYVKNCDKLNTAPSHSGLVSMIVRMLNYRFFKLEV